MTADREERSELPIGATTATRTGQGHQSSGGQVFHHVHGLCRQPTDLNRRLLQSQRLELHDGSCSLNPTIPDDGHSNHPQTGKRHGHPQPARKPLMLVNNQKSGHLGRGCDKDCTHKGSVSHHKP